MYSYIQCPWAYACDRSLGRSGRTKAMLILLKSKRLPISSAEASIRAVWYSRGACSR
jgi:hypothetical protein